jgi:hypothetical protein
VRVEVVTTNYGVVPAPRVEVTTTDYEVRVPVYVRADAPLLPPKCQETPPPTAAEPAATADFHVSTFEKAIEMLKSVMTKPLDAFAAVNVSPDTIEQIASFLHDVGERRHYMHNMVQPGGDTWR